jgi:hypothetical protein
MGKFCPQELVEVIQFLDKTKFSTAVGTALDRMMICFTHFVASIGGSRPESLAVRPSFITRGFVGSDRETITAKPAPRRLVSIDEHSVRSNSTVPLAVLKMSVSTESQIP